MFSYLYLAIIIKTKAKQQMVNGFEVIIDVTKTIIRK